MKKENFLMMVVVALLVLNFGTLGYLFLGKGHNGGMPPHPPKPDKVIIERLKLTPEQVGEFEVLKHEHHSGINQLNEASKQLYQEYFGLLKSDTADIAAAQVLEQRLAEVQMQKDSVTFDHFIKLRALCTDEQKPLFDDFVDELGEILVRQPPRPRP
jgi:periplasmic protein CpxP/Spy